MTINSLYIYDRRVPSLPVNSHSPPNRHCTCVYYQDWHRTRRPKPAVEGGILPAVSQAVSPQPTLDPTTTNAATSSNFNSPRNTLSSSTGVVVATNSNPNEPPTPLLQTPPGTSSTGLAFDEEAKLVYGVVISLRNMIKKLSGRFVVFFFLSPLFPILNHDAETNSS